MLSAAGEMWASLEAQLAKNPSAMQEPWVRSLGGEDPLEKGMATGSSIPTQRETQREGPERLEAHWGGGCAPWASWPQDCQGSCVGLATRPSLP